MSKVKKGGVRVCHPSKRNAFEVVTNLREPLHPPHLQCPTCGVKHTHKTYHIMLNDQGAAVVSPGVFEGLQNAGMGDLYVESHVEKPPNQVLGTKGGMMGLVPTRPQVTIYHD